MQLSFAISQHFRFTCTRQSWSKVSHALTKYTLPTNCKNKHGIDKISQVLAITAHDHSSPLSSGVICSIRLFVSCTSSSSQMKAVGGRSSPFPKTNLQQMKLKAAHFTSLNRPTFSPQSTILRACLQLDRRLQFLLDQGGKPGLVVNI